jgi:hypothetical protein
MKAVAPKMIEAQAYYRRLNLRRKSEWVGERSNRSEGQAVKLSGVIRSENAGMSSV